MLEKFKNWIKINIKKVLLIFIVGLVSRMFINYWYDINVFIDFTSKISIIYYSFFACFVVLSNDIISYFPSFQSIFSLFKSLPSINFTSLKLSSIKYSTRKYLSNKMFLGEFNDDDDKAIKEIKDDKSLLTLFKKDEVYIGQVYDDKKTYSAPVNSSAISAIRQVNATSNDNSRLVGHYNFDYRRNQPIQHFTDGYPVYYPLSEASNTNSNLLSQNSESLNNNNSIFRNLSDNSLETSDSNHATIASINHNLSLLDNNLTNIRRYSDLSNENLHNKIEKIIKNTEKSLQDNITRYYAAQGIQHIVIDSTSIREINLPKKSLLGRLINKLSSKLVELDQRLEEWDRKEQAKYQKRWNIYEENRNRRLKIERNRNKHRYNYGINERKSRK